MAPLFTCERHRPEQTTPYRLMQQHVATFFEEAKDAVGADLPQFVKDGFDAFLGNGILAHGFLRRHCGHCGRDKLVAFSCKRLDDSDPPPFRRPGAQGRWSRLRPSGCGADGSGLATRGDP